MFSNVKCDFNLKKKYGDYRDWFLEESFNIHKTKIQVFLEDQLMGETLFPINLHQINCDITATSFKNNLNVSNYKYCIPEMGIIRKNSFNKLHINIGDTLNMKIDINLYGE